MYVRTYVCIIIIIIIYIGENFLSTEFVRIRFITVVFVCCAYDLFCTKSQIHWILGNQHFILFFIL
jgi:hypothetical protein